jgi:MoaA/NifB/PqqE/SkfB family radical SAM enzyme
MNNETFCSLPFTGVFLGPDGGIKSCCSARKNLGSLREQPIDEIINSNLAKEVRQSILKGEWHEYCGQCKQLEENGSPSERTKDLEDFVAKHGEPTKDFFIPIRLDLRWSNLCNLNCVYCFEYFSSRWAKINEKKVVGISKENVDSLLNLIEKNIEQNKAIQEATLILGGEPLLHPANIRLLDILKDNSVYVLSNFAVPLESNAVAQHMFNHNHLGFGISFETVGIKFEYVRRQAQWEQFVANIDYYNNLNRKNNLTAHSLYSIYSAFNLIEFYDFITEKKFRKVNWNLLQSTGESEHANVLRLPSSLRELAWNEIQKCQKKYPDAPGMDNLLDYAEKLNSPIITTDLNYSEIFLNEIHKIENKLPSDIYKFSLLWPDVYRILNECR